MDNEKWVKLEGELTEGPNFIDLVMESIREAARQGIKADSIVINRNMVFVPEKFGERPAMVCGLNAYLTTDDLPNMYSFAVLESKREKTNADRIRAMSDEELAAWLLLFVRNCGAVNGNNIEWADGMEEKMLDMLKQTAEE